MAISPNIIPRVPDFGCIMATTVDLLLFLITEVYLSLITVWYGIPEIGATPVQEIAHTLHLTT